MVSAHDARAELLAEYYKLIDIVQAYDPYFVTIKSWSATLGSLALGAALTMRPAFGAAVLGVGALLSCSFWIVEAHFKILQLNHVARCTELEQLLERGGTTRSPRILQSFAEAGSLHLLRRQWRRVLRWPHVAFPHALFIAISLVGVPVVLLTS
ncbi:hypothetical protein ACI797_05790 [Geodermatophilus sp. SYSU D00691]